MNIAKRKNIGQGRIIEVFFAVLIVSSSFIVSSYMITPTNIPLVQSKGDIEKLGFNIFEKLARGKTFETINFTQVGWEQRLKIVFEKLLPPEIYFNLTVYNSSFYSPAFINLEIINSVPISNIEPNSKAFKNSPEIASVTYVYTYYDWEMNKRMLLVFRLTLARPGEKNE
jgi:uncharacterized protein YxeA